MESSGIEGSIQVTNTVRNKLQDYFVFHSRGTIAIKGKGSLETFIVEPLNE